LFIVQPFQKDSDIRSALGFMSIASRWGDYLFPGITVLTRDMYAIQAMHHVAVQMRAWEPDHRIAFRRRTTDSRIARRLSRALAEVGRQRPADKLLQVMTYWQRYGSLFVHFGLLENRRPRSIGWYRDLAFAPHRDVIGRDEPHLRHRRLAHFRWYDRNRHRLADVPEGAPERLFRGPDGKWRLWWLTGRGCPERVPEAIRLVREMEFFFIVWQTLFEAAVRTICFGGRVSLRPVAVSVPVQRCVALLRESRRAQQEVTSRQLVEVCLILHQRLVVPHVARWQRAAVELFGSEAGRFITLHNGETIAEFARRQDGALLDGLAELHNQYCELQGKPYAAAVRRFRPVPTVLKLPDISADLSPRRWGLFGYRFEAAVGLFESAAS
jgi:hypothetical protein